MITKPVAAIERMRDRVNGLDAPDATAILAYLDSIQDDAVPVVWPKELTRERLEELADRGGFATGEINGEVIARAKLDYSSRSDALRALAAIAPVKRKRMVNLWRHDEANINAYSDVSDDEAMRIRGGWRKVGGPFEIEE